LERAERPYRKEIIIVGTWGKRILGIVIGAGLVFFVGSRVYEIQQDQTSGTKKKKGRGRVVSVNVTESHIGLVRENLVLTGSLRAKKSVDVTAKGTGRLEKLHFDIGDHARQGDLVAELEDDELQQQVHRATASIAVSQASFEQRRAERDNAIAEVKRAEELLDEQLISPQEFASRKTGLAVVNAQVRLAEAQKQQAEAELRELKIRLAQTKIYSPMTGIIANRNVDEGALLNPSMPILRIVNLATMVTRGNVPERNVGRLRIGNEATVRVDAIPDRAFTGRVARIAPVLDAATRSALIEIDILNSGGGLKAEMFARIELDLGMSRDAILIPRASLVYRGEQSGVYTVEGDRPTFVAIETGLTRDDQVEVLGNLDAGVKIVGRGATMLREGDRIRSGGAGAPGKSAKTDGTAPGKKKKSAANQPVAAGGGGGAVASNTP